MQKISEVEVHLTPSNLNSLQPFQNLDKSIGLIISSSVSNDGIYVQNPTIGALLPDFQTHYTFVPTVSAFAEEETKKYMQKMLFEIGNDSEYLLNIDVKTFNIAWVDKKSVECKVVLNYRITNTAGETVMPIRTVASYKSLGHNENFGIGLGNAYGDALNKIEWDRIAGYLKVAKTAKQEKNAQVKGAGDTALEHTVIRWFIQSSPQGADVSWRVVSSTPDVANTNSNFVGTTPYESTESFDIRGLTYDNSGNVQIEVSCEKQGYLTQRKRFNLRQAIDQKEISAKFNLVKDE